jgi:hypothetical protein
MQQCNSNHKFATATASYTHSLHNYMLLLFMCADVRGGDFDEDDDSSGDEFLLLDEHEAAEQSRLIAAAAAARRDAEQAAEQQTSSTTATGTATGSNSTKAAKVAAAKASSADNSSSSSSSSSDSSSSGNEQQQQQQQQQQRKHKVKLSVMGWAKETVGTDYLVMASTHVDPVTAVAAASGLEIDATNGGIAVNGLLEAVGGIYAAGACASYYDPALGRRRVDMLDHSINR